MIARTFLFLALLWGALRLAVATVISGGVVIEGSGLDAPILNAGAPSAGTDEVQTLTIGGTPTGGTFKLTFDGHTTAAIAWSSTNNTLIANVDAALEALPNIGTGGVTCADVDLSSGIGDMTITFVAALGKLAVSTITVADNSMTGTAPTAAVAETTPGVTATGRGMPKGAKLIDTTNGIAYINTGTAAAPTWTKVGLQT